jgi:hypothetical protein
MGFRSTTFSSTFNTKCPKNGNYQPLVETILNVRNQLKQLWYQLLLRLEFFERIFIKNIERLQQNRNICIQLQSSFIIDAPAIVCRVLNDL